MPETPDIPEEMPLADEVEATPSAPEDDAASSAEVGGDEPTSQKRDVGHPPVEAAEIHGNEKEETPVLDVHMPHATHTWKDFFIHLGTITAGLLIAISLEQSVEMLHHLQQRHELEAALQAEGESNKSLSEVNIGGFDDAMTWYLGLHQDIQTMLATGGKANLPHRVMHRRIQLFNGKPTAIRAAGLTTAAWDTAAEDNRLTLLPDDMAAAYSRLYSEEKSYADARHVAAIAEDQQAAFEGEFADVRTPGTPVLARMSASQLQQYDALVMQAFIDVRREKGTLTTFYGTNNALLDGRFTAAAWVPAQQAAKAAYPDDYEKMAQEIERENRERDKAAGK
jgi:hypothetical protein